MTIPRRTEIQVPTWLWLAWEPVTIVSVCSKKLLSYILEQSDAKRYIIGIEKGKNGLEHFQIRLSCSDPEFFEHMKEWYPHAHIEKAESESFEYERKEGRFWTSEDTTDIRKVRFGQLTNAQQGIVEALQSQNDRQVDVWYDPKGNHGKTWLTLHLWEIGKALVVPRASTTPEKMSAFICSSYKGEEYVIIDIPRSRPIDAALYESIEEIKDGLVFDQRYSGKAKNIRGVKVCIFTNKMLDTKKLSHDRWRLHGIHEDGTLS